MNYYTVIPSPVDPLTLVTDGEVLTGVYMQSHNPSPLQTEEWIRKDEHVVLQWTKSQLSEFFAGARTEFDLPLGPNGTQFQKSVWAQLCEIPYGETISYGELARRIGNPNSSRAVGMANSKNPISIIVPCHRVIGANGKMVGFGGGIDRKEILLKLERSKTSLFG